MRKLDWWCEKLYRRLGGGGYSEDAATDARWPAGLQPPVRARDGFRMRLDLSDWSDRRAYFSGEYYQRDLSELLRRIVRPGDRFIDIGANIGLVTLLAARGVGRAGRVLAFEPNPGPLARLREHVAINGLQQVEVHDVALAEAAGSAELFVASEHTGKGTLTVDGGAGGRVSVRLVRGDDLVRPADSATIIKLDVEGYELKVLRGLEQLLRAQDAIVIVEVTDFMLKRVGESAAALCEFLEGLGYESYSFELLQRRWNRGIALRRAPGVQTGEQYDALFARDGRMKRERLAALIRE